MRQCGCLDQFAGVYYDYSMLDNRGNPRYRTKALVQIPGILKDGGLLKNISITGLCVECPNAAGLQSTAQYQLEIKPEAVSRIGSFQLQVDCKWVRNGGSITEIGFGIVASPKGKQFQHYVDYLAYRHSHP